MIYSIERACPQNYHDKLFVANKYNNMMYSSIVVVVVVVVISSVIKYDMLLFRAAHERACNHLPYHYHYFIISVTYLIMMYVLLLLCT